ncbi:MAG: methyltransferase domain-containing protein [Candidatus Omnitrophota bacterium]
MYRKVIAIILIVAYLGTSMPVDAYALRPASHQNVYSVKSASPGSPVNEEKISAQARTKIKTPFYLKPVFYLLIFIFAFFLTRHISTPLTLAGTLVAACLFNGSIFFVHEINKQNRIASKQGDRGAVSFDVPKREISVKVLSDMLGIAIFAISLNFVSILLWIYRTELLKDISVDNILIMKLLFVPFGLYAFVSIAGYLPGTFMSIKKAEERVAAAFIRVWSVAKATKDRLLLKSLDNVRGISVAPKSMYSNVLQDGKDTASGHILFTSNLALWRGMLKYLATRRSIGLYYDKILATSLKRYNSLFWFLFLRMLWEIRSNWELFKRSPRLYPTVTPYILIHSIQFNAVALSFLVPMGIIAIIKLLNNKDREALSYVIDTLINFDAFEDSAVVSGTEVAQAKYLTKQKQHKSKTASKSKRTTKRSDPLASKLKRGKGSSGNKSSSSGNSGRLSSEHSGHPRYFISEEPEAMRVIADKIDRLGRNQRILSIGPGRLELEKELVWMGHTVLCADINDRYLKEADLPYVIANANHLEFPEGSFDTILLCESIGYLNSLDKGIEDIHKFLRPGGHIVVVQPHPTSKIIFDRLISRYEGGKDAIVFYPHYRIQSPTGTKYEFYTAKDMMEALEKCDFRTISHLALFPQKMLGLRDFIIAEKPDPLRPIRKSLPDNEFETQINAAA